MGLAASQNDVPYCAQAPSPWGEGRGLRGCAALEGRKFGRLDHRQAKQVEYQMELACTI